jgi:prepilin-type processing-associated H-X9-DG protein
MRTKNLFEGPSIRANNHRGFSRVELLVVVAVITLVAAMQIRALDSGRYQTRRAQCVANLKRMVLAFEIYATENSDKLPPAAGSWAWDFPWSLGTNLIKFETSADGFYCPANSSLTNILWNWAPNSFRVIGYATTLPGGLGIAATNANPTFTPQSYSLGPVLALPPQPASQRVLVADATISQQGQNNESLRSSYKWDTVAGGFGLQQATSHLEGLLPLGGNLGMLDGHVEWRNFADMHPRTDSASAPAFWW